MISPFTIIVTILCFILSIPIGGWLARRRVIRDWTLAQELEWWLNLITGKNR